MRTGPSKASRISRWTVTHHLLSSNNLATLENLEESYQIPGSINLDRAVKAKIMTWINQVPCLHSPCEVPGNVPQDFGQPKLSHILSIFTVAKPMLQRLQELLVQ